MTTIKSEVMLLHAKENTMIKQEDEEMNSEEDSLDICLSSRDQTHQTYAKREVVWIDMKEDIILKQEDEEETIKHEEVSTDVCINSHDQTYQKLVDCKTEIIDEIHIKEEPQELMGNEDLSLVDSEHITHPNFQTYDKSSKTEDCINGSVDLNKHARQHADESSFQCKVCKKKFKRSIELKYHEVKHTGEIERRFECPVCRVTFKQAANLKRHEKSAVCIKRLKNLCNFKKPEETYTAERPISIIQDIVIVLHQCTICTKKFKTASFLQKHYKTHSDETHQCTICEKKFKSAIALKCHELIHNAERPHQCTVCKRKFTSSYFLQRHIQSHEFSDEKTFQCTVCDRSFKYAQSLEIHGLTHTEEERF